MFRKLAKIFSAPWFIWGAFSALMPYKSIWFYIIFNSALLYFLLSLIYKPNKALGNYIRLHMAMMVCCLMLLRYVVVPNPIFFANVISALSIFVALLLHYWCARDEILMSAIAKGELLLPQVIQVPSRALLLLALDIKLSIRKVIFDYRRRFNVSFGIAAEDMEYSFSFKYVLWIFSRECLEVFLQLVVDAVCFPVFVSCSLLFGFYSAYKAWGYVLDVPKCASATLSWAVAATVALAQVLVDIVFLQLFAVVYPFWCGFYYVRLAHIELCKEPHGITIATEKFAPREAYKPQSSRGSALSNGKSFTVK